MGKIKDSTIPEWDTHSRLEGWSAGMRDGYAAALRDAVKAVRLSCSADIELVERTQVIAEIEALGGKQ